jgi:hypothetical protein
MEWLSGGGSCGNGRGKRMGRTPCGQTLFCQPPHFCRGGYLIRPAEELHKSAFSLAKRDSFSVWLRPARRGIVFPLAQLGPQPSRWRQAVSWRLCRLETARTLWVLCRLTDGTYPPAGKTTFSFAGERGVFTLQLVFACPAGAKTTFSFVSKRKSGSGLRKRKGRPVEILGRCGTTGRWICTAMVSLG